MDTDNTYQVAIKALTKMLKGYYAIEKKTSAKEQVVTSKYFKPDIDAIIFVLTNRAPQLWSRKPEEATPQKQDDDIEIDMSLLSEGALREITRLYDEKSTE